MRVENNNPILPLQVVRGKRVDAPEEAGEVDRASISRRAADLSVAFDALKNAPEVREDTVRELKAQIDAGTFVIDEGAIAAKLRGGK